MLAGADRREFAGLESRLGARRRLECGVDWALAGEMNGIDWRLVANGPGPALAAEALEAVARLDRPDAVVSFGFCGALDPALGPGEVFVAGGVLSGGRLYPAATPGSAPPHASGLLVSGDRVAVTAAEKAALRTSGASAVDMEAAAVARAAAGWGVPLYVIRAVTDTAHESFAVDFNAIRRPDGRFGWRRLAWAAVKNPRVVLPDLLRLAERARLASRNLGEFVACCQF